MNELIVAPPSVKIEEFFCLYPTTIIQVFNHKSRGRGDKDEKTMKVFGICRWRLRIVFLSLQLGMYKTLCHEKL